MSQRGRPVLDRASILAAVMPRLLQAGFDAAANDDVGRGSLVAIRYGVLAGLPVAREVFGRLGLRTREVAADGSVVQPDRVVLETGGTLAAITSGAPIAISFLERLSAIASGAREPDSSEALDLYAARLSAGGPVRDDGPAFRLELEGSP